MSFSFFLRGFIIGFSIAAPVGPIGILCIRRTLTEGQTAGLLSGLGAATADAFYGCIAGFGLTFVSGLLISQAVWVRFIGGIFLCYLGVRTLLSKPSTQAATTQDNGLKGWMGHYISTVFLTLTNPATILSFAAVFAALGLATPAGNYLTAMTLVAGVFVGSALWWVLLSAGVSLLRSRFNPQHLKWLNRISGLILLGFGIMALNPTG